MSPRRPGRVIRDGVAPGVPDDPDFEERFRRHRARRWARGIRNGISPLSLVRFRLGLTDGVRFHGVDVAEGEHQATYRLIEDIWMRGEYDVPGFVPRAGWHVIDIGANVGIYAMLAASRGARITAYEPSPVSLALLRRHTGRWGVTCHHAAVVGYDRAARLFLHPMRHTRNTMIEAGIVNAAAADAGGGASPGVVELEQSVEVPTVTIGEVLSQPCDLLKIACEGGEFEMFAHAGDALGNVRRIILELHGEMQTQWGGAAELLETVRSAGFRVDLHEPLPGMSRQFMTATRG